MDVELISAPSSVLEGLAQVELIFKRTSLTTFQQLVNLSNPFKLDDAEHSEESTETTGSDNRSALSNVVEEGQCITTNDKIKQFAHRLLADSNTKLSVDNIMGAGASIEFLFRCTKRFHANVESLQTILSKHTDLSSNIIEQLARVLCEKSTMKNEKLEQVSLPCVTKLDWSVGMTMANDVTDKIDQPFINLTFEFEENGAKKPKSFQLNLTEFRRLQSSLQAAADAMNRT